MKRPIKYSLLVVIVLTSAEATPVELITNGGFETGTFAGWTVTDQGGGLFAVQSGTLSPLNGSPVPAPPGGGYAAMSDQPAPGTHVLTQTFLVPIGTTSIQFSARIFRNNQASVYYTPDTLDFSGEPNQQAFVDILSAGADPLSLPSTAITNLFASAVGDPANDGAYFLISADLTGVLSPGMSYALRFAEVDNQLFFNLGVDDVSILAEAVPEPSTFVLVAAGLGMAAVMRRPRK